MRNISKTSRQPRFSQRCAIIVSKKPVEENTLGVVRTCETSSYREMQNTLDSAAHCTGASSRRRLYIANGFAMSALRMGSKSMLNRASSMELDRCPILLSITCQMSRSSSATRKPLVGRPPGADGDETRERIMESALEAFAEHGYDAMSVRELTRQLGVSHNLVHHYFGSKSELWYAAVEHSLGQSTTEILTRLEGAIGDSDPVGSVRRLLGVTFMEAARHPAVLSIIADESGRGGERLDFLYKRFLEPAIEITGRFLEAARPHGICDMDPAFLALHVLSTTSLLFTHDALFEKLGYSTPASPEMQEAYSGSAADLMVMGLFG